MPLTVEQKRELLTLLEKKHGSSTSPAQPAGPSMDDLELGPREMMPEPPAGTRTRVSYPVDQGTIGPTPTPVRDRLQETFDRSGVVATVPIPGSAPFNVRPTAPFRVGAKLLAEGTSALTDFVRQNVLEDDPRSGARPLAVPTEEEWRTGDPNELVAKAGGRAIVGFPLGIAEFFGTLPDQIINPPEGETLATTGRNLLQGGIELPLSVPAEVSEVGDILRRNEPGTPGNLLGQAARLSDEFAVRPANLLAEAAGIEGMEQRARESVRTHPENLLYGFQIGRGVLRKTADLGAAGHGRVMRSVERGRTRRRVAENVAESQIARESSRFQKTTDKPASPATIDPLKSGAAEAMWAEFKRQREAPRTSFDLKPTNPRLEFERFLRERAEPPRSDRFSRTETGRPATQTAQSGSEAVSPPRRSEALSGARVADIAKKRARRSGVDVDRLKPYGAAGAAIVATTAAMTDEDTREWALAGLGFMGFARGRKGEVAGRAKALVDKVKEGKVSKELAARYPVNLNTLKVDPKSARRITKAEQALAVELERVKGKPLSHQEIIDAAQQSQMLNKVMTRDQALQIEAALLKARQQLAAASKYEEMTPELLEALMVVSSWKTFSGRLLNSLNIKADPVLSSTKNIVLDKILEKNQNVEAILKDAKSIDWSNSRQVTELYRRYVKPDVWEWLDEYRYINLLSSPRTHIVNATSNFIQGIVLRPSTMAAGVVVDRVASLAGKKERTVYARQIPEYYKGYFNALPEASQMAMRALTGKDILERPDVPRIPTNSPVTRHFYFIPRALEAGDVFFRTLITEAEYASLAKLAEKQGKKFDAASARVQAENTAAELVFRKVPDPQNVTGQGSLLSTIDKATELVYKARDIKAVRWFVPFVMTPMNIFKQGIEYSPLGLLTIKGNASPRTQLSKALVGSTVTAAAAGLAMDGLLTWAPPRGKTQKELFYEAGMQPYSIKIGGKWVGFSKLGPLAYPFAMAAAFRHAFYDQNRAMTDSDLDKITKGIAGVAGFFSDQSYVQGIGELIDAARGEEYAITRATSNIPRQMIPLTALQGWVNRLIDPYYRKSENLVDDLQKNIIGLSQFAPPYTNTEGEPSRRELRGINALSPMNVRSEDPLARQDYDVDLVERQRDAVRRMARDFIRDDRYIEAGRMIAEWNRKHPDRRVESFARMKMMVRRYDASRARREARARASGGSGG